MELITLTSLLIRERVQDEVVKVHDLRAEKHRDSQYNVQQERLERRTCLVVSVETEFVHDCLQEGKGDQKHIHYHENGYGEH